MNRPLATLLTAAALTTASLQAQSAVRYEFQAFSAISPNVVGSFWFETSDFIQADLQVSASSLGACSVVQPDDASCFGVLFKVDTTEYTGSETSDAINFQINVTSPVYYFQNGAFGAVGTYESTLLGTDQQARLTVSQVPEVGTAAMAAAGLLMIGALFGRRRPA